MLDNKQLLLDPRIRAVSLENIGLIFHHTYWWPTGEAGLYRPFTTLTYLFNYAVLGEGERPFGYHALNILLHLGNVFLAWALARRIMQSFWPSAAIASIWAVHPVLTESVTNIVGRADLLAAMAVLSGFLLYLKARSSTGAARFLWLAALAVMSAVGVFSKESAVAIFPILVLYELLWPDQSAGRRILWFAAAAAMLIPIAIMLYARSSVLASSAPAEFPFTDNPIAAADFWAGRLTAVKVMVEDVWTTIFPWKLSCDYSWNQIPMARGTPADWLACAVILLAAAAATWCWRRNRVCFFLAAFGFLNFAPSSNLLFTTGTIRADRLLYLPALGLTGCIVVLASAAARKRVALPAACIIIAAFSVRTYVRNRDWQSDLTIATADVLTSPNSFKLHRLLATSLYEADPTLSNIDQVISEQQKSLALLDSVPDVWNRPDAYRMAGYYLLLKARKVGPGGGEVHREAIHDLLRCLQIDAAARSSYRVKLQSSDLPDGDAEAYLLLSIAYLDSGDPLQALQPVRQAIAINPLDPRAYRQLSAVLLAHEKGPEADRAAAVEDAFAAVQRQDWVQAAELSGRELQTEPVEYPVAFYLNAVANLKLGNRSAAESSTGLMRRYLSTSHSRTLRKQLSDVEGELGAQSTK